MVADPFAHLPPLTPDEVARVRARAMAVPISSALGLSFVALERGVCTLAMTRDPRFDGIDRSLHGGLLMTLADSAGAFALLSVTGRLVAHAGMTYMRVRRDSGGGRG